jgi:hypothetical protein
LIALVWNHRYTLARRCSCCQPRCATADGFWRSWCRPVNSYLCRSGAMRSRRRTSVDDDLVAEAARPDLGWTAGVPTNVASPCGTALAKKRPAREREPWRARGSSGA